MLDHSMFSLFPQGICFAMSLGRSQVEINPYARAVLQKRMQEGFLHEGSIHDDVTTYQVPRGTKAFGAGGEFPCQAGHSRCFAFLIWWRFLLYFYLLHVRPSGNLLWWTPTRASGPEKCFAQAGVQNFRSTPRATKAGQTVKCAKPVVLCLIFAISSRQFIYLENVKSILSKQKDMMKLMRFLIQAPHDVMQWLSQLFCF